MNRSESIANLAAALCKAQAKLKNPHFDAVNPHFKSKFASLGAVREAVIPTLSEFGISLTQWPVSTENGFAGCRTVVAHESGEWMEETFLIPVDKGNAHGYASAVTYTKRISMQSVAAVVGDEDDDGNAAVTSQKPVSAISGAGVKRDAFDSLEPDEQVWISDLAREVTQLVTNGEAGAAVTHIDAQIPQVGEKRLPKADQYKLALWSKLHSKVRADLTAYRESIKQKEAA